MKETKLFGSAIIIIIIISSRIHKKENIFLHIIPERFHQFFILLFLMFLSQQCLLSLTDIFHPATT